MFMAMQWSKAVEESVELFRCLADYRRPPNSRLEFFAIVGTLQCIALRSSDEYFLQAEVCLLHS